MEFGKFKDATSLFEAYLSLEKSFTKKCQEAKELSKKLEEAKIESIDCEVNLPFNQEQCEHEDVSAFEGVDSLIGDESEESSAGESVAVAFEKETQSDLGEDLGNLSECALNEKLEMVDGGSSAVCADGESESKIEPDKGVREDILDLSRFKGCEWRKEVSKFFAGNQEATKFKTDIARLIVSSPALWGDKDCLSKAFQIVKNNSPASNGNEFMEEKPMAVGDARLPEALLVGSNKNALDMTVGEYLQRLTDKQKNMPRFIRANKSAGAIGLTQPREIKSLSEAKDFLLKNYFK